jgi:coatomer subunit beta
MAKLLCANRRSLLLGGDYFLGAVIAATFTKLVLRLRQLRALPALMLNRVAADLMLYIVGILRLGDSHVSQHPVDADSVDRIAGAGSGTLWWPRQGVWER